LPGTNEFKLDSWPAIRLYGTVFALLVAAGLTTAAVLFLSENITGEEALLVGGLVIVFSLFGFLGPWLMSTGVVRFSDDRLEVRTLAGKHLYRLVDIGGVRLRRIADLGKIDRGLAAISGVKPEQQVIEIKLNRSLRFPLLPRQFGTEVMGIPSIVARTVRLQVTDPEGFAQTINQFVRSPAGGEEGEPQG